MVWTTIGEFFITRNWQTTIVTEGELFKLEHFGAKAGSVFAIAEAEANPDNNLMLIDVQEYRTDGLTQLFYFKKPGFLNERRLAIKKITIPTIEDEIKKVINPTFINPSAFNAPFKKPEWKIKISESDYVEPGLSQENNSTINEEFIYNSDGDKNGFLYWLGTLHGTKPWMNPQTRGEVLVTMNSNSSGVSVTVLTDREPNFIYSANVAGSSLILDIGPNKNLIINHYSIRSGSRGYNVPRNWNLRGSKDENDWTVLKNHVNDSTIAASPVSSWGSWAIENTVGYRYFMVITTGSNFNGNNSLELGEIELYGKLIHQ